MEDQPAHNQKWASYWNAPLDGGKVGLRDRMRLKGSLNLDLAVRNHITNIETNLRSDHAEQQDDRIFA